MDMYNEMMKIKKVQIDYIIDKHLHGIIEDEKKDKISNEIIYLFHGYIPKSLFNGEHFSEIKLPAE